MFVLNPKGVCFEPKWAFTTLKLVNLIKRNLYIYSVKNFLPYPIWDITLNVFMILLLKIQYWWKRKHKRQAMDLLPNWHDIHKIWSLWASECSWGPFWDVDTGINGGCNCNHLLGAWWVVESGITFHCIFTHTSTYNNPHCSSIKHLSLIQRYMLGSFH